jgi:hypothetical protein
MKIFCARVLEDFDSGGASAFQACGGAQKLAVEPVFLSSPFFI